MNVGLLYTPVSIYQMTRGALVLFVGVLCLFEHFEKPRCRFGDHIIVPSADTTEDRACCDLKTLVIVRRSKNISECKADNLLFRLGPSVLMLRLFVRGIL